MHFESFIIVSGLADDHAAVRDAVAAAAKLVMCPAASVVVPVVPPDVGFALVLAVPEPVTAADLAKLREALVFELDRREVRFADLAVEQLDEGEA